jgi:hypothetical protein
MPVIYEDFIRCQSCDSPDFKEEKIITIPKTIKSRESIHKPLEGVEEEYRIVCAKCGVQVNL